MTRKAIVASAIGLLLIIITVAAARRHPSNDIATFRVEPTRFERRVSAEGTMKAVKSTVIAVPQDVPRPLKIAWLADDGTLLKKGDTIVRFDPTDFESELLGGNEDRSTAANKLTKAETESGTTRVNLTRDAHQAQSELEAAKRFKFDDAEVFSRYQRIEAETDQALAGEKKQHAEEVLGVRETLARTDRELLAIENRKAMLRIRNAEQGLKSLEILAPHDGILVLSRDWRGEIPRVGATTYPGFPLAEIPDLGAMKAEVFVLEADAAGLAINQKATVSLASKPDVKYPGKVTQLDKLARPRTRGVPVQYFGATVTFDRTDPKVMKPGARVRAVLEVENLANAFAVPRQVLFENEGKKIAYRRSGSKFIPVEVTISTSSAGRVVVTKGLKKGDELALSDPTKKKDEG